MNDDGMETLYLVFHLLLYGVMLASQLLPQQRDPSVFDQRLMWTDYVERHTRRNGTFTRRLRMELDSFNKLLEVIREDLEVNQDMADLRGGAIIPELYLFCTIRWLAGGSYLDIVTLNAMARLILNKLAEPMPLQPKFFANVRIWKTPSSFKSNVCESVT